MAKRINQERYEKRCQDTGLVRVHPVVPLRHRQNLLDHAKALREGTLTDTDRLGWMDGKEGRLHKVIVKWGEGKTLRETIDLLIREGK